MQNVQQQPKKQITTVVQQTKPVQQVVKQTVKSEPKKTVKQVIEPKQKPAPVVQPKESLPVVQVVTAPAVVKQLTEQEEIIVWNQWRSNLQNQVMRDTKISAPIGTVFKFSFTAAERFSTLPVTAITNSLLKLSAF